MKAVEWCFTGVVEPCSQKRLPPPPFLRDMSLMQNVFEILEAYLCRSNLLDFKFYLISPRGTVINEEVNAAGGLTFFRTMTLS